MVHVKGGDVWVEEINALRKERFLQDRLERHDRGKRERRARLQKVSLKRKGV